MALVQEFGYAVYGVPDLDQTTEFFRTICQLEVSERRDDTVFLTADHRHAWIRLERRPQPGLIRLGFRVAGPDALSEITMRLEDEGITDWSAAGTLRENRIADSVRFRTPDGIEIELYEEQVVLAASPAPDRGLKAMLHTVVFTDDVIAGRDFWKRTMDFRRSDQIEDLVVFLRCGNGYHHSIGLAKGEPGRLDHICLLADGIDTVVRFRNHARAHGVKADDLVRHTASGSVSVYLEEPSLGIGVEICAEHDVITDDSYNGRLLMAGPVTADRWSVGFPDATPAGMVFGQGGGTSAGAAVSAANTD
jgi:catechol 2,3-dioxygenase-like lactoylglutathione lyase family enzyme